MRRAAIQPKTDLLIARYAAAWVRARESLGIRVVAPFALGDAGTEILFVAHLPDWGGPAGIVLDVSEAEVAEAASIAPLVKAAGYTWSRLSSTYRQFDAQVFREALDDWGFHGPPAEAPAWYGKRWFEK